MKLEKPNQTIFDKYNIDYELFEQEILRLAKLTNLPIKYNLNQSNLSYQKLADYVNNLNSLFIHFYLKNEKADELRIELDKLILLIKDIQREILLTEIGRKEIGFENNI